MKVRFLIIIFFTLTGNVFSQTEFSKQVEHLLQHPDYNSASFGIHICNMNSGETVYNLNAEKLLIPASTMKLLTTAAAIEILGDDYQFTTTVGYIGETEKNLLKGDLVLIGGGDPVLGSEYFQNHYYQFLRKWVRQIKELGIERIQGNLILDNSIYDSEKVPSTWIWEDMGNYYGAGANPFTVYDNMFRITFRSPAMAGKQTKIVATYPKIDGIEITNKVLSSDENRDLAYVYGSPLDKKREIRGTIPKNRKAFTIKAAIHHPEEVLAKVFVEELAKQGIWFSGEVYFKRIEKSALKVIYIQESPTLDKIIEVLNYESINLFAEHLVRQIAFEETGNGNRETGIEIIRRYFKSQGLPTEQLFMDDGSGLSHFNAASPKFLTSLLQYMKGSKSFVQSLPVAGEGTLYQFNPSFLPDSVFRAKSGSMTRVRCYAGYIKTDSNKELAFSFMVNHFSGSHNSLIKKIQGLLVILKLNY